jgi:energy-coupling factor transport system ATP-binding protein
MVMQNPESHIVTDVVWHELAFGLENLGFDSGVIRCRVAEMASFFGIGSWFHKKTSELSGGQKQLLNLASVLAMQPRLLLLDEPTSQLDPIAAREFTYMVKRLNRELGITVIMSEHRLEEVLPAATRVVLMENGSVKYNTTPRSLPALLIENGDTDYISYLPAAAKIFAQSKFNETECPLTVREGRSFVANLLKKENVATRQNSVTADSANIADKVRHVTSEHKSAVECIDVFFKYAKDSPDVLCGLSMSADYGELLCILGENGSGKSTLLQIAAGLLQPQRGKVKIGGLNIRSFKAGELYSGNIGLLPQNPKSVFLHYTLRADLGDNQDGEQLAAKLGIEKLLDRHPYDLSGGEQQKAALLRVLLTKPRILLLDEPTKGLDARAKDSLALILLQLCAEGVCIIASTHDIEFAAEYASRCLMLFDGSVASQGATRDFFSGNCFYTTAANRIARDFDGGVITCGDVVKLCGI